MKKGVFGIVSMLILFTLIAPTQASAAGTLTWDASSGTVQGYRVYYGTTSGGPYSNSSSVGTATSYSLNSLPLQQSVNYYLVVRAYNQAGESPNSNQVSYTATDTTPPAPPQGVTVK